ncbi:NYN domain-containing protein [Pseudomonas sp. P1B16]|nr:NYN domain-containing protein [Pseudomonas sp. P1B16]
MPTLSGPCSNSLSLRAKNATDSAMIIDAMDLLYSKNVDAFALMTSDSDFTPLVLRLLESGLPRLRVWGKEDS